MIILSVNVGSSSLRLSLHEIGQDRVRLVLQHHSEHDEARQLPNVLIDRIMQEAHIGCVDVFAHRIVHGGPRLRCAVVVNDDILRELDSVSSLAPLHNPPAIEWLRCAQLALPCVPHVAVFDTMFFVHMPLVARRYALPRELCDQFHLQRYGFHGMAHEFMWTAYANARPDKANDGRVISLQLGSGCSIAAVHGGVALDTSMGFSPLEGLVMSTRCGDIDAGLVQYLQRQLDNVDMVSDILEHKSGLLGISGLSGDMKHLIESHDEAASAAVDLFCYRAQKYIGAYFSVLQGCDAIVFGGGIGQHSNKVRERIVRGLKWLGVQLSESEHTRDTPTMKLISTPTAPIEIFVADVDEAQVMALHAISAICQK